MKPQSQQPRKRKQLTLAQRVKVIQRRKNGDSIQALKEYFDVGRTQITVILKNKEDIMRRWGSGEAGNRKLTFDKKSKYHNNDKIRTFPQEDRVDSLLLNSPMLKGKAMGNYFQTSDGKKTYYNNITPNHIEYQSIYPSILETSKCLPVSTVQENENTGLSKWHMVCTYTILIMRT